MTRRLPPRCSALSASAAQLSHLALPLAARVAFELDTHEPAVDPALEVVGGRAVGREEFILDVLSNYTTYDTYYRIEKAIHDDPEYKTAKARAAIARFLQLHPHNLAQKAEMVVEHFREHPAKKIAGKAKAMVVTSSRLHAVRYKLALDRYIHDKSYQDVHALVAFSGTVFDSGDGFTEPSMNGFPESQTPMKFEEGDYQPYCDATVAIPTDPNLLYDTRRDLDAYDVFRGDEVENAARLLALAE